MIRYGVLLNFADCLENRGITTTLDEMTSGLGDEDLDGFTISKSEEDTLSQPAGISVIDGKLYVADSGNHRVLRWNGIPSEDTINRVFSSINSVEFETCFIEWVNSISGLKNGQVIAIDGKTIRGAKSHGKKSPIQKD